MSKGKKDRDAMLDKCAAHEKATGIDRFGDEIRATAGCPGDAAMVCQVFKAWSADRWNNFALLATIRYNECKCDDVQNAPPLPMAWTLDCSQGDLTCEEVCDAFVEWACSYRSWALEFTQALTACYPTGWNPRKVPGITNCGDCKETCRAMNRFHKRLSRWWERIMIPLNEICDTGGTGRVPPPPEPPPFA